MDEEQNILISRPRAEKKIYRKRRVKQYEDEFLYVMYGVIGLAVCIFIFFLIWAATLV